MIHQWTALALTVFLAPYITATAEPIDLPDTFAETISSADCRPEIHIQTTPPWSICLNRMNPGKDSCAEVTIDGSRIFGALLHFSRSDSGAWRYSGMTSPDSTAPLPDIRMELINGPDGNLVRADFYPHRRNDSLQLPPELRIDNDRPVAPDTAPEVNLNIRRTAYDCHPKTYKVVVEQRLYTYPPGYRRDPVLNHAELSMFHSGMSVRMPTAYSLEHRAMLYVYWRVQQLAELKFDDPQQIMKNEAAMNRWNRKRPEAAATPKKPPIISFRALR